MHKWEYLIQEGLSEYKLSMFGEQGWELVAVTCNGNGSPVYFYFKRPKD